MINSVGSSFINYKYGALEHFSRLLIEHIKGLLPKRIYIYVNQVIEAAGGDEEGHEVHGLDRHLIVAPEHVVCSVAALSTAPNRLRASV